MISNIKNLYNCLLEIFLNVSITLSVFFHSFTISFSYKVMFSFYNMCLLILHLDDFLWSSNLLYGLPNGETVTCAVNFDYADDVCFSCVFSSFFLYICCCVFLCFLIFSMKAFCYRFEYSSLLRQHKFDILSAAVKFCLMTLCLSDLLHVNLEFVIKISKV